MKKKFIHKLLSFCLVSIFILSFSVPAFAAENLGYDQASALKYVLNMEGRYIDTDNGSYDCVDIAKAYFRDVGGKPIVSLTYLCGTPYAYNYADPISDGAIPSGWTRCYYSNSYIPQPGDVAVWKANEGIAGYMGHVAIVTEVKKSGDGHQIKYMEQSTTTQKHAAVCKDYVDAENPSCYIVPTFNQKKTDEMILASESRFTVLVLDNSGPQEFIFPADIFALRLRETTYTSNSSIEEVKAAASSFLHGVTEFENNYIAIVKFSNEACVVCDFTNDLETLEKSLDSIEADICDEDVNSDTNGPNINAGLLSADELLSRITNPHAVKNIVLCTTGFTVNGDHSEIGKYSKEDETVPSTWQNMVTEVKLYTLANVAVATAERIKESGTTIYTLGIFEPIESALPSDGKILAQFFRTTAKDLASSESNYYPLEDPENLVISFDEVEGNIDGKQDTYIYVNGDEEPVLFESTLSSLIFSSSSVQYNPKLSYMLMALAYSAYNQIGTGENSKNKNAPLAETNIFRSYESLGLKDIQSFNYYDDPNDPNYGQDNVAVTVGWQTLPNFKKMIVVSVRGSFGTLPDSLDWQSNFNLGDAENKESLHEGFNIAAERVIKILEQYTDGIETKNTVYVVTGHSRGAGVANLVSYKLMSKGVLRENLFDYNFACPDVARSESTDWNPYGKYSNIFNINNCSDPVGRIPGVLGTILGHAGSELVGKFTDEIKINGSSDLFNWEQIGTSWGKFGNTYWFSQNWNNKSQIGLSFNAHAQSEYINYLSHLKTEYAFKGWDDIELRVLLNTDWQGLLAGVFCPVDVTIATPDGKLLASVRNGIIEYGKGAEFGNVIVLTQDDKKLFFINGYDDVNISFEGNETGEMTYMYTKINLVDETVTGGDAFTNVALTEGKTMRSTVSLNDLDNTILYATDENDNIIARIAKDGTETKMMNVNMHLIAGLLALLLSTGMLAIIIFVFKKTGRSST